MGRWLGLVLHRANATVGDSPKIAGLLELLATKGSWDLSVRLAFQVSVAESPADASGGDIHLGNALSKSTAPGPAWWAKIGSKFNAIWRQVLDTNLTLGSAERSKRNDSDRRVDFDLTASDVESGLGAEVIDQGNLEAAMIAEALEDSVTWDDPIAASWDGHVRENFVRACVNRFLHASLFDAMVFTL